MTIRIFGAGPAGIATAWGFKDTDDEKRIYERYNDFGGTWVTNEVKDRPTNSTLYTQHSPQILSTAYVNTISMWREMGIDYKKLTRPYTSGSYFESIIKETSFFDKIKLASGYLNYCIGGIEGTVQDRLGSMSEKGWNAIDSMCYLLDGVGGDKLTADEFFGSFDQGVLYNSLEFAYNSKDPDYGYSNIMQRKINLTARFYTEVNYELDSIVKNNEEYILKLKYWQPNPLTGLPDFNERSFGIRDNDTIVLCLDALNLIKVLDKSHSDVQNSWGPYNELKAKLANTYSPITISYPFTPNADLSKFERADSVFYTKWKVICLVTPPDVTKDGYKTLSCCLLDFEDTDVLSKSQDEVINEVAVQLQLPPYIQNLVRIDKNTTYDESSNSWEFKSSSCAMTEKGSIPCRGNIPNLHLVGVYTPRKFKPTTMEAATEAAYLYHGKSLKFRTQLSPILLGVFLVMLIIVLIIYRKSIARFFQSFRT